MRAFGIFAAVAAIALSGCSAGESTSAAKAEVVKFHEQAGAGQFAEIYKAAGPDIRNSATEEQFVQTIGPFHTLVGKFQSAPEPGWTYNTDGDGQRVTLEYDSTFERGKAKETFIYKMNDGKAVLASYNYKADESTIKPPAPAAPAPDAANQEGEASDGEAEGT